MPLQPLGCVERFTLRARAHPERLDDRGVSPRLGVLRSTPVRAASLQFRRRMSSGMSLLLSWKVHGGHALTAHSRARSSWRPSAPNLFTAVWRTSSAEATSRPTERMIHQPLPA